MTIILKAFYVWRLWKYLLIYTIFVKRDYWLSYCIIYFTKAYIAKRTPQKFYIWKIFVGATAPLHPPGYGPATYMNWNSLRSSIVYTGIGHVAYCMTAKSPLCRLSFTLITLWSMNLIYLASVTLWQQWATYQIPVESEKTIITASLMQGRFTMHRCCVSLVHEPQPLKAMSFSLVHIWKTPTFCLEYTYYHAMSIRDKICDLLLKAMKL